MQVKYIPDCFYHSKGSGLFPSHEAICVINDHTEPVNLRITLYFEDRDKLDGFTVQVAAERTLHIRMDKLRNDCGQGVPMRQKLRRIKKWLCSTPEWIPLRRL